MLDEQLKKQVMEDITLLSTELPEFDAALLIHNGL